MKTGGHDFLPVPGNCYNDGKTYPAVYKAGKLLLKDGKTIDPGSNNVEEMVNLLAALRYKLVAR